MVRDRQRDSLEAHRIGPDQNRVSQSSLQGKQMVITFGVDAARSSVGTLHRTVERHDEVAADPTAALWCGMAVQLHQGPSHLEFEARRRQG